MVCSAVKSVNKGAKTAQMTIFYGGQVVVFDDFPADKANEIMSYARGKPQSQNNSVFTYTQSQPSFPPNLIRTSADSSAPIIPSVTLTNSIHEHSQPSSRPVVCGNFLRSLILLRWIFLFNFVIWIILFSNQEFPFWADPPIARKASLHRFLLKRKDRYVLSPKQRNL